MKSKNLLFCQILGMRITLVYMQAYKYFASHTIMPKSICHPNGQTVQPCVYAGYFLNRQLRGDRLRRILCHLHLSKKRTGVFIEILFLTALHLCPSVISKCTCGIADVVALYRNHPTAKTDIERQFPSRIFLHATLFLTAGMCQTAT